MELFPFSLVKRGIINWNGSAESLYQVSFYHMDAKLSSGNGCNDILNDSGYHSLFTCSTIKLKVKTVGTRKNGRMLIVLQAIRGQRPYAVLITCVTTCLVVLLT